MIIDIYPCATCVHKESVPNGNPCWKCIEFQENSDLEDVNISGKFYKKRIITNADRIRSMTDEELANWYFDKFFPCVPYCSMLQDGCPEHDDCKICLLEWLRQES